MGDNIWGTMIQELRVQQKFSQRQLAIKTQVNRSTISRIEREGDGDIKIIERVLNFLGYELDACMSDSLQEIRKKRLQAEQDPTQRSKLSADIISGFTF